MKKLLSAAAVLLWAGVAFGQSSVTDGQKHGYGPGGSATTPQVGIVGGIIRSDTSGKALTMTSDGYLRVAEASPNRDANLRFESIIDNSSIAYNAADSSAVLDVHRLRHMKLLIKATPLNAANTDTAQVIRLAFQIRTHLNQLTDSSSVFAEYAMANTPQGVDLNEGDTLHVGHLVRGGRNGPWSGEFVVQISPNRSAHASALAVNGRDFYYPNGIALPLDNVMGRDFWSDYMSLRVRNIGPAALAVKITVHLIGTPL